MQNNIIPDRSQLMDVLWDTQRRKRCIEPEDITKIAKYFDISKTELEGVISFYHFFRLKDVGRFTIYLNDSIISEYSGREDIKRAFEEAVGTTFGNTTKDNMFGLYGTSCIGLSDYEPACLINFKPFLNLTPEKVHWIIDQLKSGKKPSEICDKPKSKIHYTPSAERTVFFKSYKKYSALDNLTKYAPDKIIDVVMQSKLAGRGGAFFPTGLKWQFCSQNSADQKYIVCNCDEGEPGTFKDRALLEYHPELLIEGMIFAAYAVGATKGAIYLRGEYRYMKKDLEKLIEKYKEEGYLGKGIKGKVSFDFDIYVHLGAGAYICGEETALLHSMEGKRGEPGTKEYFPVARGFKNKPTVVNNVETLCAVTRIFEMGVDNWLKLGTEKTPGTKLLSVSGDCKNKGIYEVEWGMKFDEFLKLTEAEDVNMVQFSGPSGDCLRITKDAKGNYLVDGKTDTEISGEDLSCGGSVMIFNKSRDVIYTLKSYSDFFVAESCGICVPCRTGNFLLNRKLERLINGNAEHKDIKEIVEWSNIIKTTSRCGLGQMSNNSLLQAIEKFPEIFENALAEDSDFNRCFDLEAAVADYDRIINELNTSYE